jgi:hypothetical protein
LIEGRLGHTGVVLNDKIYWAGGIGNNLQNSCLVEVKDIITGTTSMKHLFKPGFWWQGIGQTAVIKNNKIIFLRHDEPQGSGPIKFDIYDVTTNIWSVGVLPFHIELFSVISVNNTIYIAGGIVNGVISNQVYRLEF